MNRASQLSRANLITARDVVKDFSGHRALNHVSMEVPEGSIYGLLGPNGAGKTTLLRIINQITAPDQGSILFEGSPIGQEHRHIIGYLPEERGLYKKMKVGEQALYLAQLKGLSRQEAMKRLKVWFQKFEIEAWWEERPHDRRRHDRTRAGKHHPRRELHQHTREETPRERHVGQPGADAKESSPQNWKKRETAARWKSRRSRRNKRRRATTGTS